MYGIEVFAQQEVMSHNRNKTPAQLLPNPSYQLVLNSKVNSVVIAQLDVETLLKENKYYDVIKTINSLEKPTAYLQRLKLFAQRQIEGINTVTDNPKQLAERIYRILELEKWNTARKQIKVLETLNKNKPDEEITALIHCFNGIILVPSGVAKFSDCSREFNEASKILNEIARRSPEERRKVALSRYRVASNYGDYLMRISRYRNSYSTIIGDDTAFTDALLAWSLAYDMYNKAFRIATEDLAKVGNVPAAARLNLASLYLQRSTIVDSITENTNDQSVLSSAMSVSDTSFEMAETLVNLVKDIDIAGFKDGRLLGQKYELLSRLASNRVKDVPDDFKEQAEQLRKQALEYAERAKEFYLQSGKLSKVASMERTIGSNYGAIGDTDNQLEHLLTWHTMDEILREEIPEDRWGLSRAGYAKNKESLIELLIGKHRDVEALTILESAKGRSLQDVLLHNERDSVNPALRKNLSVADIVKTFPKNMAALEYFIGRKTGWVFLVVNGHVKAFPIVDKDGYYVPPEELLAKIKRVLHRDLGVADNSSREYQTLPQKMNLQYQSGDGYRQRWEESLYQLRQYILPDCLLDEVRAAQPETVMIVPHSILHYFPFAALVVEKDAENNRTDKTSLPQPRFLLQEKFDIYYAPSLSSWDAICREHKNPIQTIAAMGISKFSEGDALPGCVEDIENIKNIFGNGYVTVASENKVTAEVFQDALTKSGLLFLGTHGVNDANKPLKSFLVLQTANGNDDLLYAEDIFNKQIKKDLIVLSCCYSGLAEKSPMPGDDLFGIQRAMLASGAGAVIAGMWDIYDETGTEIMKDFHRYLAKSVSAVSALANAQRDFLECHRKKGRHNPKTHPYFWAVYTLTGNGNLRYQNPR
jgi:CHAT domain-containing protein